MSAAPARPFGQRKESDRKGQIRVGAAREQRRCECTLGIVCMGEETGQYACGRSSWDVRFCESCQVICGQPEVAR